MFDLAAERNQVSEALALAGQATGPGGQPRGAQPQPLPPMQPQEQQAVDINLQMAGNPQLAQLAQQYGQQGQQPSQPMQPAQQMPGQPMQPAQQMPGAQQPAAQPNTAAAFARGGLARLADQYAVNRG
jgi:hypothetical protein